MRTTRFGRVARTSVVLVLSCWIAVFRPGVATALLSPAPDGVAPELLVTKWDDDDSGVQASGEGDDPDGTEDETDEATDANTALTDAMTDGPRDDPDATDTDESDATGETEDQTDAATDVNTALTDALTDGPRDDPDETDTDETDAAGGADAPEPGALERAREARPVPEMPAAVPDVPVAPAPGEIADRLDPVGQDARDAFAGLRDRLSSRQR